MKILLQAMNVNGKYWKYLLMILNVTTNAKVIYSWTFFTSNERHIGVGESILTKMKRIWIQMNVNEHQKVYLSAFSCRSVEVIYQKRVRVFHQGFQTPRNRWKHEAAGRVLLLFRGVWNPWWNTKHEFLRWLLKLVWKFHGFFSEE